MDLTFASDCDLWEELKKRNHAVLLVTLKNLNNQHEESSHSYCGGKFICIGLAESAKQKILNDCLKENAF